jgi:RNA polymerase sigma-70 factor (ECF subfamily)
MVVIDREQAWSGVEDVDLVLGAQSGDIDAFAALYERYQPHLMRYCRSRLGNWDDAADATQETFLRAWRAFDMFGGDRLFLPWARVIATNVCTDALRRRMRSARMESPDTEPVSTHREGEELCVARVDTDEVMAALVKLSERHREILRLREYEGLSYEDIAEREDLDLNAVKSLIWRARQALRREIVFAREQGRLSAASGFLPMALLGRFIARGQRIAEYFHSLGQGAPASVATAASSAASVTAVASLSILGGMAAERAVPPTPDRAVPAAAVAVVPIVRTAPRVTVPAPSWARGLPPRYVAVLPQTTGTPVGAREASPTPTDAEASTTSTPTTSTSTLAPTEPVAAPSSSAGDAAPSGADPLNTPTGTTTPSTGSKQSSAAAGKATTASVSSKAPARVAEKSDKAAAKGADKAAAKAADKSDKATEQGVVNDPGVADVSAPVGNGSADKADKGNNDRPNGNSDKADKGHPKAAAIDTTNAASIESADTSAPGTAEVAKSNGNSDKADKGNSDKGNSDKGNSEKPEKADKNSDKNDKSNGNGHAH